MGGLTGTLTLTSTGAGNVNVDELSTAMFLNVEVDAQTQDNKAYTVGLVGGDQVIMSHTGGNLLEVSTIAAGTMGVDLSNGNRNFTLTQSISGIRLQDNAIDVGAGDVNLTSAGGSIDSAVVNGAVEITASTVDLNADLGIGANSRLELAAAEIAADNMTSGNVDLLNVLSSNVVVTSLTTVGGGNIQFEQSGGGDVAFGTVSTTSDASPIAGEDDILLATTLAT